MISNKQYLDRYLGEIGDGVCANVEIVKRIKRKGWQDKYLLIMRSAAGHVLTITTPGNFEVGSKWEVVGTIKKHSTFCGNKQTHISWEEMRYNGIIEQDSKE